jgi:serine/threonine protein kinase
MDAPSQTCAQTEFDARWTGDCHIQRTQTACADGDVWLAIHRPRDVTLFWLVLFLALLSALTLVTIGLTGQLWILVAQVTAIALWCYAVALAYSCGRRRLILDTPTGNLGPYRIRSRIASGGMGDVFLAEHTILQRRSAIKIMRPDRAEDSTNQARFEREIRLAAQLCHPNIVSIYDGGRLANGTFYCAMEYLDGLNLQELVEQEGPLPAWRAIGLVEQVCAALSHAHQRHLVHRDLKPANIFAIIRDGHDFAKLLDFGLVRPLDGSSDLTLDGLVTGSPLYLSPEQATGDSPADERSDIYSLGAVIYFLLTGRPPFCDSRTVHLLMAHAQRPPTAVSEFNEQVSLELEALVMQCLSKRPEDRFDSTHDLLDALRHCPEHGESQAMKRF